MPQSRQLSVRFPAGGLNKRHGFQDQPPFTTSDAQNVWPEDVATGRSRGGRRPGTKKRISTVLPSAIRMLAVVNLVDVDGYIEQLVGSAGGQLYRHRASDDTWQVVSTALRIATDRLVMATPFEQQLIIADWGIASSGETLTTTGTATIVTDLIVEDSDGIVDVDGVTFTSATVTDFEGAGVVPGTHVVRVRPGGDGTPGVYAISDVDGGTITLATSPGSSLTGVVFEINVDLEAAGITGDDHRLLVLDSGNGTKGQYDISAVADDEVTLTSAPAAIDTDGIHYQFHRAPKVWDLLTDTVSLLTAASGKGEVPLGCNIVTTHNNRVWFAGDVNNLNAWYACRAGDLTDWLYGDVDATSAEQGTEYRGGQIGQPITALISHNEDCMVVGANDSIYVIRGDVSDGGYIIRVNSKVGPIAPNAWCRTDYDELVMLTRSGLYVMAPGCGDNPDPVSRLTLPNKLLNIDTDVYTPLLAFDQVQQAVHVYLFTTQTTVIVANPATIEADGVTIDGIADNGNPIDDEWTVVAGGNSYRIASYQGGTITLADAYPTPPFTGSININSPGSLAYWVDWSRTLSGSSDKPIWPIKLGDKDNTFPSAIVEYPPWSTNKIAPVVLGTVGGRTLVYDRDENEDDGNEFEAFVVCGPVRISPTPDREAKVIDGRMVAALGPDSLQWQATGGMTAEKSMPGYGLLEGTWQSEVFAAGDYREHICIAAHAITIRVSDKPYEFPVSEFDPWSFEELVLTIEQRGMMR